MNRRTGATAPMSPADVRARARKAHGFLDAARLVEAFREDDDEGAAATVVASLAVLAGIAAADALCGEAMGMRSNSGNHADAIALLKSSPTNVAPAVAQLRALVDLKSRAHYEPRLITAADASGALTSAERLLIAMDAALT